MTEETNPAADAEEALFEAERAVAHIPEMDRQIGILLARRQLAFEKAYGSFVEKAFDWRRVLGCEPSELIREWDEKGVESAKFRNAVAGVRKAFFPPGSPAAGYSFVGFRHDAYDCPLEFAFRRLGGNRFEKFTLRLLTKDGMQLSKALTLARLPPCVWVTGASTGQQGYATRVDYGATASWEEARCDIGNYTRAAESADPDDSEFPARLGAALREQEQDRIMRGKNGCDLVRMAMTYQTVRAACWNFDPRALQTLENCLNIRQENYIGDRGWSIREEETFNDGTACTRYEIVRPRVPVSAFPKTEELAKEKLPCETEAEQERGDVASPRSSASS